MLSLGTGCVLGIPIFFFFLVYFFLCLYLPKGYMYTGVSTVRIYMAIEKGWDSYCRGREGGSKAHDKCKEISVLNEISQYFTYIYCLTFKY